MAEVPTTYGDELPAGSTLCGGQYTIERYLNSGGFGVTYLAADSLGRQVVIKECFPSAMCCRADETVRLRSRGNEAEFEAILELFEKEARALAALQHPYIVGVHQYFRDNGTAYMAMDYIEGRTLLDVIEDERAPFGPREVKRLLIQLLQAVGYIHSHDILHRDISPDNILIDADNLPVLIDFGAARQDATRVSRVLSKVLTVKDGYSPQEFYLQGSDQVFASDLYALAATFYHVVSKTPPPSSHTRIAAVARDQADPLQPLVSLAGYDSHFIGAINRCLNVFPKDRLPTAEAWRDEIDVEARKRARLEAAERDREIEEMVAALVAEFRKDFVAAPSGASAKPDAPTAPAAPARAKSRFYSGVTELQEPPEPDPEPEPEPEPADPEPAAEDAGEPQDAADQSPTPLRTTTVAIKPRRPVPQSQPPRPLPEPPRGWLDRLGFGRHRGGPHP